MLVQVLPPAVINKAPNFCGLTCYKFVITHIIRFRYFLSRVNEALADEGFSFNVPWASTYRKHMGEGSGRKWHMLLYHFSLRNDKHHFPCYNLSFGPKWL
jgi:hypothetical protein